MRRCALSVLVASVAVVGMGWSDDPKTPAVITPGACDGCLVAPPSDAVVLFDGTSVDGWTKMDGKPAGWKAEGKKGGSMTIEPKSGAVISKAKFGDAQVHIEFKTPVEEGEGQNRGNSGVYLQGRYEVQVLDSFKNVTYPDGQCGAIYKQHMPLVNACRPQGEWQAYDIVFRAARFDEAGKLTKHAVLTVFHNGVLIHDHVEVKGSTGSSPFPEGPGEGPLYLQDHGHKVEYRNVWIRKM